MIQIALSLSLKKSNEKFETSTYVIGLQEIAGGFAEIVESNYHGYAAH